MMFLEELITFIGRWHPLLVHLPIGILILAFAMDAVDQFYKRQHYIGAIRFALLLGTAAAVTACITGYFLSRNGGYDAEVLGFHQWLGIAVAAISMFTFLLYRDIPNSVKWMHMFRKQRFKFMLLTVVLLGLTGHFGGTLTHGDGFMKDALPTKIKNLFGLSSQEEELTKLEDAQEALLYQDIIQPILRQRCQSCHGEKKQDGGLALHNQQAVLRGGDSGAVLTKGDTAKSELYTRLVLPEGHEKRMPPKGRTPITEDQIRLIAWWIGSGAGFEEKTKEIEQSKEILAVLTRLENREQQEETHLYASMPVAPALPKDKISAWQAKGIKVMPVATENNMVIVNAVNHPQFSDDDLQDLLQIKDNIVQLKVGRTAITDEGMKTVSQFSILHRLHLEYTAVTDEGLSYLHPLKNLTHVNLVGTKVTEHALAHLQKIPTLIHVYAFNTTLLKNMADKKGSYAPVDTGNYVLPILSSDTVSF